MKKTISVRSHAKVNLYLKVLNTFSPPKENYHDLASIFQTVSLADTLHLTQDEGNGIALDIDLRFSLADRSYLKDLQENNLIQKVFEYFQTRYGIGGVKVVVEKHIPLGAGLGGGSSNAIAMIWMLNKLFDLKLTEQNLYEIANGFGSDALFFLKSKFAQSGLAKVEGSGDHVTPWVAPGHNQKNKMRLPYWMVIVYPDCHVATATAYDHYVTYNQDENVAIDLDEIVKHLTQEKYLSTLEKIIYNSFEAKVLDAYPSIKKAYARLKRLTSNVLLSGSGSTVFGIFATSDLAKTAYEELSYHYKTIHLATSVDEAIVELDQ